jgi:hypothetical protein
VASPLPVHFLTIVLNGQPFLRHHVAAFEALPFPWHWHVVEGAATLTHDTAWSLATGGRVDAAHHRGGRSVDGTEETLDEIARTHPGHVTVHRKPRGTLWDGKLEMVNAPLSKMRERGLLWAVDVDELWTTEQLVRGRALFLARPDCRAAYYRCRYFVGPDLVVTTRDGYGNGAWEWLRTWRYRPGDRWLAHEPPILVTRFEAWGQARRRRRGRRPKPPFLPGDPRTISRDETEREGLVFQHLAYVLDEQVRFKETYYGYAGALERWRAMQGSTTFPVRLRDVFPWVTDAALVDRASDRGLAPIVPLPRAASSPPAATATGAAGTRGPA